MPQPASRRAESTGLRQNSGKENQSDVKPFIGTLRVTNPAR